MALTPFLIAAVGLVGGFFFGRQVRVGFGWSWPGVVVLLGVSLLPWYAHHGLVLDVARFGAVQSEWTRPDAFTDLHRTGYVVALLAACVTAAACSRIRWALGFAPGLAMIGTLLVTHGVAEGAVTEGYFVLPRSAVPNFWVASLAATGLLFGYSVGQAEHREAA